MKAQHAASKRFAASQTAIGSSRILFITQRSASSNFAAGDPRLRANTSAKRSPWRAILWSAASSRTAWPGAKTVLGGSLADLDRG